MVKSKHIFLHGGFILILLFCTLFATVWGEQPDIDKTIVSNMDVFDADLRDVFRSLADYGKINVLLDKDVHGTVTTRFQTGMSVRQAIEILAQTNGYSFRWMMPQRTVLIGNENTFKNIEAKETKIYSLKYAEPDTVVDTLKSIVPKERIGVDKRTNQLAITANVLEHQNISEVITKLDREMPQISVELRIEEITRTALDELGVAWDAKEGFGLNFVSPQITYVAGQKLKLWEEQSKAKLLSKPMVATTDSKEAIIFIGDRIPVPKTTTDAAGNSSTSIDYLDVGTKLMVTPRINDNNIVTVTVKANLSNLNGYKTIAGNEIPVVRNREAGSVVRLLDGETFMLSGLNQEESTFTESGIKGLNKIPLLGHLFKSRTTADPNNASEIVIFITPKILRTESLNNNHGPAVSSNPENNPASTVPENKTVSSVSESKPASTVPENKTVSSVSESKPASTVPENKTVSSVPDSKPVSTVAPVAETSNVSNGPKMKMIESVTAPAGDAAPVLAKPPVASTQPIVTARPQQIPVIMQNVQLLQPKVISVKVKPGDSVKAIAKQYGITPESVQKENSLKNTAGLKPGQELVLTIPGDHLYKLRPKETVWRVAKRYGITIEVLKEINHLVDITQVAVGQVLILPVSTNKVADSRF